MQTVGQFLGILLKNHKIPQRAINVDTVIQGRERATVLQMLHHAPNFQQLQIVQLIVGIYNGVPESFEVFYCHFSSTEEELSLFLERIEREPLRYLILEVNNLPSPLQEVCDLSVHAN